MTFQHTSFVLVCTCLHLASLIASIEPAHVHEARQGPISTEPLSLGPGPESTRTSSSTHQTTTMSATPSSEPSLPSSSTDSLSSSSAFSITFPHPSSSSRTLASTTSSESSSATPQPSSSPGSLKFTVQNMTTCTTGFISWSYSGQDATLALSITNIGVSQDQTVNSTIQQQLADTNASALSWTWPSVDLTQGWYEVQGFVFSSQTVRNNSAPFFISNGTDVSCLTSTSTSPQTSTTVSPGLGASSSSASSTHVGSVVGGVVGGVVGVLLVIVGGICLWSRKRKTSRFQNQARQWGSLLSTTSSILPSGGGAHLANNHFHSHSESTGAILQGVAAGGKVSAASTPGGSDEDVITVSEEKLVSPASSCGMSPFDVLNTPIHYDRRASTYSIQTPTTAVCEGSRNRVPSLRTSTQSLEQQAQRIRSSMETTVRRRAERLSMPTLPSPALARIPHSPTYAQPREEYPLTPVTPTAVNRSISAGAVSMTARRTSRKPVPQYDSSVLVEDKHADSISTFTAGAESLQSHGTGHTTGTHGTHSDSQHKASFADGRPVHYLMPDMPLPQQD